MMCTGLVGQACAPAKVGKSDTRHATARYPSSWHASGALRSGVEGGVVNTGAAAVHEMAAEEPARSRGRRSGDSENDAGRPTATAAW